MRRKKAVKFHNRSFYIISLTVFAAAVILLLAALHFWEISSGGDIDTTSDYYETHYKRFTLENDGKEYKMKRELETILFIGLDKTEEYVQNESSYRNTQQSDFLMLVVIDNKERKCTAIHINRDTMAQIQILGLGGKPAGTDFAQLALSHTYGSGKEDSAENTVKAVSGALLGFPVNHYVTVTLDAVPALNDAVGGVTVTVNDDFGGIDDTLIQGEQVTLLGEHALKFVRTRKGMEDSTNLHRMERQREYISDFLDTFRKKSESNSDILFKCLNSVSGYMETDCSGEKLSSMLKAVQNYDMDDNILTLPGEAVFGEPILGERHTEYYVDEDELRQLLIDNFFEK